MKKITFILFLMLGFGQVYTQNIITVDNNSGSGAMYTNLQQAVDAANQGDIIHVAGSPNNYGNITVRKRIKLIGAGFNSPYGSATILEKLTLGRINQDTTTSGSLISGLLISQGSWMNPTEGSGPDTSKNLRDIAIESCFGDVIFMGYSGTQFRNITVKNSYLYFTMGGGYQIRGENIVFSNCILWNSNLNLGITTGLVFRNSLFINKSGNQFIQNTGANVLVENCIFYKSNPQGLSASAFNNNITFQCTNDTLPGSGNIGSGNLISVNPMFVNFPLSGSPFSLIYDYHLQSGSPGSGAGTDGTDIGLYGGSNSTATFGVSPSVPQVMKILFQENQSTAPVGGSLNVQLKARKRN